MFQFSPKYKKEHLRAANSARARAGPWTGNLQQQQHFPHQFHHSLQVWLIREGRNPKKDVPLLLKGPCLTLEVALHMSMTWMEVTFKVHLQHRVRPK